MFKPVEWMEIFAAPCNNFVITVKGERVKIFVLCLLPYIYLLYALSVIFYRYFGHEKEVMARILVVDDQEDIVVRL